MAIEMIIGGILGFVIGLLVGIVLENRATLQAHKDLGMDGGKDCPWYKRFLVL